LIDTLQLSLKVQREIVDHARLAFPRECCGILAGKNGQPTKLYRITNSAPGNRLYEMDDLELFQAIKEIDERSEDVFVIYHSHPESEAYPSQTDVSLAFYPESYYVICSLEDPEVPNLRAFTIVDTVIQEIPISPKY
jgi:[CysO sulfur-carrier protein]-S-L-cysteine hydrolase